MTVRLMQSSDANAPVLTGVAGSLITLLNACLVNGYGSTPALGWTKAYSGTNKAAYAPAGAPECFYRIEDHGRNASIALYESMTSVDAGVAAYTGAGTPYPPLMLNASSYPGYHLNRWIFKSFTNDTVARPWILVGDERSVWLFTDTGAIAGAGLVPHGWGDFTTFSSGDIWNQHITACYNTNNAANTYPANTLMGTLADKSLYSIESNQTSLYYYMANHAVARRSHTGAQGMVLLDKAMDPRHAFLTNIANGNSGLWLGYRGISGLTGPEYPHPILGGASILPWVLYTFSSTVGPRGMHRGLWAVHHNRPFIHGDTFSGTGALSGKSFMCLSVQGQSSTGTGLVTSSVNTSSGTTRTYRDAQILIETSNTWS